MITIEQPNHQIHNYIIGKLHLSTYGTLKATNLSTGHVAWVDFEPKGWVSKVNFKVNGFATNAHQEKEYSLKGSYETHLNATRIRDNYLIKIGEATPLIPNYER